MKWVLLTVLASSLLSGCVVSRSVRIDTSDAASRAKVNRAFERGRLLGGERRGSIVLSRHFEFPPGTRLRRGFTGVEISVGPDSTTWRYPLGPERFAVSNEYLERIELTSWQRGNSQYGGAAVGAGAGAALVVATYRSGGVGTGDKILTTLVGLGLPFMVANVVHGFEGLVGGGSTEYVVVESK